MNAEKPCFRKVSTIFRFVELFGTLIAIHFVGQRDTRWLTPLTVSSGYQGEEGNHTDQALQTSHGCSAFYFFAASFIFKKKECSLNVAQTVSLRCSPGNLYLKLRKLTVCATFNEHHLRD
jgi:hypothetical protein